MLMAWRQKRLQENRGHALIEYSMTIGLVAAALAAITIGVQRGTQAVFKRGADMVGVQAEAEQVYNMERGYFVGLTAISDVNTQTTSNETSATLMYEYQDTVETKSLSESHLGEKPY